MRLKEGVKLVDVTAQIILAAIIVQDVYRRYIPDYSVTITSMNDSVHGEHSLHYKGRAADFRTKDLPAHIDRQILRDAIKLALGSNYDVLLENAGGDNEHIHVEYDPKG